MHWLRSSPNYSQAGMTLFEMILAMMMLVIFTGSVAIVMQFTTTFMAESDRECDAEVDPDTCSQGLLIDHANLQIAMDQLVEILVQPDVDVKAYSVTINSILPIPPGVRPSTLNPHCERFPIADWNLSSYGLELHSPENSRFLPPGYEFCLWQTEGLWGKEASLPDLISNADGANPGLYILQAVPTTLSPSSLPTTRRLFCRPRPFC